MLNQNFINDKDLEKYGMKNDIFTEQTHAMMKDFVARQNEIMMNILAAHEISEKDMIAYGSKQIQGGITTLFYKEKPIAEFFEGKMEVEGTTVRIIQEYRMLK